MSLVRMLMRGLRMLHCGVCMLLALGMIALAVMFGRRAVGLRCVLVMLRGLVVLVSSHIRLFAVYLQPDQQAGAEVFVPDCIARPRLIQSALVP
jgi:hypothetical protein